jgi:hypothetical protein
MRRILAWMKRLLMRLVQHWLTNGNFARSSLDMSGAFSVIGYLYQDLSLEELRSTTQSGIVGRPIRLSRNRPVFRPFSRVYRACRVSGDAISSGIADSFADSLCGRRAHPFHRTGRDDPRIGRCLPDHDARNVRPRPQCGGRPVRRMQSVLGKSPLALFQDLRIGKLNLGRFFRPGRRKGTVSTRVGSSAET